MMGRPARQSSTHALGSRTELPGGQPTLAGCRAKGRERQRSACQPEPELELLQPGPLPLRKRGKHAAGCWRVPVPHAMHARAAA